MKEYDLDSYVRKWRQTCGIFSTAQNELKQGTFTDFFEINKETLGVEITTNNGEKRFSLERPVDGFEMVKIEYYPIESGWYPNRHGYALLVRKHVRGFSQGLSANNHDLTVYSKNGKEAASAARWTWCDFLHRPTYKKLNPKEPFGIMNERIWWNNGLINFLHRTIGYYTENKVTVESRAFIPYIKPLLEEECQIGS